MPNWRLKRSFTAGEISPLMYGRPDLDAYRKGCKALQNMVLLPQGPVQRRPGLEFIYDLSSYIDSNFVVRFIPFVFSETQSYTLMFFENATVTKILFVTPDGVIEDPASPGNPLEITMATSFGIMDMDYAQSFDYMILTNGDFQQQELIRVDHDDWTLGNITFTSPPVSWGASDYPAAVTFHEQRLAFADNASKPNTTWLSKAGDIFNFSVSSPLVADDAITFTLNSGQQNRIQWLHSAKDLITGTLADEWSINGGSAGPVTPASIFASRESNQGSERIKPIMINSSVYFVERHGKTVNEMTYDFNLNGYGINDRSILAEHLIATDPLADTTYQQTPASIIWSITKAGQLLGFTVQREHKVLGWHRHQSGDAEFKALASIPGDAEDVLMVAVKRTIDSTDVLYLEKMDTLQLPETAKDVAFLDSFLRYDEPLTPITTVTNLEHLEGETVSVLADGANASPKTVSSGQIELDKEATHIVIGQGYDSEVEPLIEDLSLANGPAIARVQRINDLYVYIYKSLLFEYGNDRDDLETEAFRLPSDSTGEAIPLFSGVKKIPWPEGFDEEPTVIIRQNQPFPLTITGIVDEVEVYN